MAVVAGGDEHVRRMCATVARAAVPARAAMLCTAVAKSHTVWSVCIAVRMCSARMRSRCRRLSVRRLARGLCVRRIAVTTWQQWCTCVLAMACHYVIKCAVLCMDARMRIRCTRLSVQAATRI